MARRTRQKTKNKTIDPADRAALSRACVVVIGRCRTVRARTACELALAAVVYGGETLAAAARAAGVDKGEVGRWVRAVKAECGRAKEGADRR